MPSKFSSTPLLASPKAPPSSSTRKDTGHVRNCADFPPSKWNDYFTKYSRNDADLSNEWHQIEGLESEVKENLQLLAAKPLQQLTKIDAIQLLGLGYRFENEIEQALQFMLENVDVEGYNLYYTSLHFRLLRQQGYNISSSIFKKFIGEDGALKEGFQSDVQGMLSFFEAAQLRVHADAGVLDEEALAGCVARLQSMAADLSPRLRAQVNNALRQSIHKDIPWHRARNYITTYQEDESHDTTLLRLAKLHFNVLQKHHQQELSDLSKQWNNLDMASKFHYARVRLVESYMWALAIYYEPKYSLARKIFTKLTALITIMDDTYDAYGTADELPLLTESINRGDKSMFEQIPDYARALCEILLDFYAEIEDDLAKEGRSYRMPYLIEWMKIAAKSYFEEFLWLEKKCIPTMEEYRRVAFPSSAISTLLIYALAGMSDIVTKAAFDWFASEPDMVIACQLVGRFQDDIVTHEFEQQREHIPSAVHCYMNQYKVNKEDACKELSKEISNAWMVLNEGCLKPTAYPFPVLERMLNFARLIDVLYKDGDSMTLPSKFMEDKIIPLLVNSVTI
uniref:Uncharacterized protein n=1 Tax=Kalanchoe fedtschenkoi TaxID=63787 RepID=A0A7N0TCK2_KALFE